MPGEYLPPVVTRLEGDIDDLIRKVEEAKAAIKSLGGTSVKIGFDVDQASLARAKAAATAAFGTGITVPVRFDVSGAGAAGALAGRAGFGAVGWLMGLAGRGLNLFGGVLPGILGSIGAIHLLIDGVAEVLAVLIPASIAIAAFGIAASDAVNNIIRQFTAIHTVMDATGKAIPPMTDAMEKLHQAVQPQVYSILGDALTVINNKAGEFAQIAKNTADVFSYFAARATVALTSQGMSQFLRNAVNDVKGLFNVFGNIAGTIGAVLKNLPGYAEVFLNVLQSITHGVEVFANSGVGQGIIRFGLAFHGAFIYLGLLGTLVARVMPIIIGWFSKLAISAGFGAEGLGLDAIAAGLFRIGGAAQVAAEGPWGWIGLAAVGIGILAYKIATAQDATQQWLSTLQSGLANQSAGKGVTALAEAQVAVTTRLASATMQAQQVQQGYNQAVAKGGPGVKAYGTFLQETNANASQLTSGQKQLSDQTNLYNFRLSALAQKYGGTTQASNLLTQAGVKVGAMLDKSSQAWKIIQQQVSGVVQGYAAMAQRGGVLGADLFILTQQASDQYQAMQKLNQAWQTFISTLSGFQGSAIQVIQTVRQMNSESKAAGASFTGVNANSLTLQQTFQNTFVPQIQNVIAGMRQAHDSAKLMSQVIAGALVNAVNQGALANKGMRTEIYDMAREADPNATNSISFLKAWVDRNATSFRTWMGMINNTTAALGHLPKNENLAVHLVGKGQFSVVGTGPFAGKVTGFATGGRVPGYGGGDRHLALLEGGEAVVSKEATARHAALLRAMGVPGMATGGLVPSYSGNVGGLGPWAQNDYKASINIMAGAMAKSFQSAMSNIGGGGPGGGLTSAGGQYNEGMLERLWQQAGGPGGYIAHIAAAIALAESGGNPIARNPSGASGLWQILGQVVPGNIFNPFVNALNAVSKFDSAHGFSPWVTYTTGAYRRYMDNGGYLQPGLNIIHNNTGQREQVLAPGQGDVIELHVYLDGREITSNVQMRARRYNRRNGVRGTDKFSKPA